jgi:hypothetical protein
MRPFVSLILLLIAFSSCGVLIKTSKYQLSDGYYMAKSYKKKYTKVYLDNNPDTLSAYYLKKENRTWIIDTTQAPIQFVEKPSKTQEPFLFIQPSFDVDVLTILFKFRPESENVPVQINTNLNTAIYVGYRTDLYHVRYKPNPLGFNRYVSHYGFSFGAFGGIGATSINPSVTKNMVPIEYDGFVITKGAAAIAAVGNVSLGITLGFDNLIGGNQQHWVYENRPWVGLAFGLNLN